MFTERGRTADSERFHLESLIEKKKKIKYPEEEKLQTHNVIFAVTFLFSKGHTARFTVSVNLCNAAPLK